MRRVVWAGAAVAALAACGGNSGTGAGNRAAFVYLERGGLAVDTVLNVDAFGPIQFTALVLDANRVEMAPGTYALSWRTTAPPVVGINGTGEADVSANGSALIIVTADGVSDTAHLIVSQQATRARVQQDTIVAFVPGATALDGSPSVDTLPFTARRTDANDNVVASAVPITYDVVDTALFAIAPNAGGDTVRIIGKLVGIGRIALHFGTFTDTVRVQVAGSYKTVSYSVIPGGIVVSPGSVTIPAGAAVLFRNPELSNAEFLGTGWRVGPVSPTSREGQVFGAAGTFPFTIGSGSGTIVVTP
jgi:hypothetical protein